MNAIGSDRPAHALDACGIAVMAKASLPGRSKTRLVPPLTYAEAAVLNTAFIKDIADNVLAAARRTPIAGYMAYGPPGNAAFFRAHVHPDFGLFEACLPDFGGCLYAAVCELLNRGHCGAIVLNSDSPTLPTALIVQAAELLRQGGDRAVLGPASDGGYYLLGLGAAHPRLFADIAWSTSRVAEQTLERAGEVGLEVHVLAPWYDVDDGHALSVLDAELAHGRSFNGAFAPYPARHTSELLGSILSTKRFAAAPSPAPLQLAVD
jgi:rSAM/selenodomain-associated transferase 1